MSTLLGRLRHKDKGPDSPVPSGPGRPGKQEKASTVLWAQRRKRGTNLASYLILQNGEVKGSLEGGRDPETGLNPWLPGQDRRGVFVLRKEPPTSGVQRSRAPKTHWVQEAICLDGAVGMGEV